ncbi:hypothetical protein [Nostoc sp.]|uniref:hypothetical protein n=1 Tax=Nostoc sp. TaxID=1180 RepID=UPI002FFA9746
MINLDTNTAIAFIAEGSHVRHELQAFVNKQQMVIAQTAFNSKPKSFFPRAIANQVYVLQSTIYY